jgi:hypothetical protein
MHNSLASPGAMHYENFNYVPNSRSPIGDLLSRLRRLNIFFSTPSIPNQFLRAETEGTGGLCEMYGLSANANEERARVLWETNIDVGQCRSGSAY